MTSSEHDPRDIALVLQLPSIPVAPSAARRALEAFRPLVGDQAVDDLQLLVTEAVTNAVRHASTPTRSEIEVSVRATPRAIRIEVIDCGPGFTPGSPRLTGPQQASGWGLYLIDRLSARWGVFRDDHRTHVWFEVPVAAERSVTA